MGRYTKEQLPIIKHTEGNILVVASPGSGKTRTMIGRVHYLISTKQVALHEILVLTFGRDTSEHFRSKLGERHIPSSKHQQNNSIRVCTFHSFALRQLNFCVNHQVIPPFDTSSKLRNRYQWMCFKEKMDKHIAQSKDDISQNDLLEIFSEFKNWCACKKAESHFSLKNKDLERIFELAYSDFENKRLSHQLRATDDWVPDLVTILKQETHMLPTYKYILVDEFQDVNAVQLQILEQLAKLGGYVNAVGDQDQAIYSWRGSKPEFMDEKVFSSHFDNPTFYRLSHTFRFGHAVSLVANSLISHNKARSDRLCISHDTTPQSQVQLIQNNNSVQALLHLLLKIGKDWQLNDVAILCRTNANVLLIEMILRFYSIPYRAGEISYDKLNDNMVYTIALLTNLLIDKQFFPEQMSAQDRKMAAKNMLQSMTSFVKSDTIDNLASLIVAVNTASAIESIYRAGSETNNVFLFDLAKILERIFAHGETFEQAKEAISYILVESDIKSKCQKSNLTVLERNHIERWHDALIESLSSIDITPRFVVDKLIEKSTSREGIHVMTCHRAKGLEFPVVIISELYDRQFPSGKFDLDFNELSEDEKKALEEERRLLYVGITRAQQQLHLISPSDKRINKWQEVNNPSSYPTRGDLTVSRFVFETNIKKMGKFADAIHGNPKSIPDAKNFLVKKYVATLNDG